MAPIRTVGLLGLGKMGAPMAKHIAAKGYAVVGYDPAAAASAQAAAHGASIARSPREVAEASDVVIIVVGFDSEVEQALFSRDGIVAGARRGLIVALGSTVAPRYAKRLAGRLGEKGIVLLDVPLARGEAAAVKGELL